MYRPEGWLTPYIGNDHYTVGFELGADAILEALRKQGQQIDNTIAGNTVSFFVTIAALKPKPNCEVLRWEGKGMVVFIPDE